MVEIPTSRAVQRVSANSGRIAPKGPSVSTGDGLRALGAGLDAVGQAASRVELEHLEAEADAEAKQRDAEVADKLREMLYNPETGFANLSGQNAVAKRNDVLKQIEGFTQSSMTGLSKAAQQKLESSIRRRVESASMTVDRHTGSERTTWLNGASDARIYSAQQDALVDFSGTNEALLIVQGEVADRAKREGWSPEQTSMILEKKSDEVFTNQIATIAATDPIQAMEYMQANKGRMSNAAYSNLEVKLKPEVSKAKGREIGRAVQAGMPVYQHETQIEFNLGAARPNPPDRPVLDVIGRSAQDVFGVGARVVVTSGQEDHGKQHGSNRHKTGNAADIQIIRPDGSVVNATDPDMVKFAKAAAKNGALGVGFGKEYMGGNHIHVDLVEAGAGQANTWASGGKAIRGDIVSAIDQRKQHAGGGIRSLLEIKDPIERKAALDEYALVQEVTDGERKMILAGAQQEAYNYLEAGGDVNTLPLDIKTGLGQKAMDALRTSQSKIKSGQSVETDMEAYYTLRKMRAEQPAVFSGTNLIEYSDKLSPAHMKEFMDAQSKPRNSVAENAASTLMSNAARQIKEAGFEKNKKAQAKIQTELLQWQDKIIADTGEKPSQLEIDKQVGFLLGEVVTAEGYMWDTKKNVFNLEDGDITVQGVPIPKSIVLEQFAEMRGEGIEPTTEALTERLETMMRDKGLF